MLTHDNQKEKLPTNLNRIIEMSVFYLSHLGARF